MSRGAEQGRHRFSAYGLVFDSEIPAPGVAGAPPGAATDVTVRRGPVRTAPGGAAGAWALPGPGTAVAEWDGLRMRVEDGVRVTVDLAPGLDPAEAGLSLLYAAPVVLLHQRGALPMHAASVAGPAVGALLIGDAGAGKSTFAAMLAARGFALGSDDLAALDFPKEGPPRVLRGVRAAKLFDDSRAALAADARALVAQGAGFGKEIVEVAAGPAAWPAPLRAVFALEWLHPPEAAPELERLRGAEALARLRAAVGRPELIRPLGLEGRYFGLLARIAAAVPVFALRRPRRYEASGQAADLLSATLEAQAAAQGGQA